ncbi:MAG: hypothetical protein Q7K03_09695, partial [Dehalococcoidia bacterium]|nr:hypothetical protein [Dehalococcoidia bacterium]
MRFFKKKLSEKAAAYDIVLATFREEKNSWSTTYEALKESCAVLGHEFSVQKELTEPWFDLALAKIALSLRQIENLYDAEQAARIRSWVFKCIDDMYQIEKGG